MRDNTGVSGVVFTVKNSNGKKYTYATSTWVSDSGKGQKHFPVAKYGLLEAYSLAFLYREQKIKELNDLGYGYTENHGK